MKAAVLYGKEDVRVEDVVRHPLQPGEVRIDIKAALTCGTDLKVYKRGYHAKMIVPPAVFGHELAGVVSEACPAQAPRSARPAETDSTIWQAGDRVVVANSAPCGECFYCRNNQENLCDDLLFLNGAYAESIVVPARIARKNMLRLKPQTQFRDAALVEPLACVVQGIEDMRLRHGQRVLVIGAGPIGLMFVVLARRLGCYVAVLGRGEKRLETARRLGASQVFKTLSHDGPPGAISAEWRFDAIIEAVGKPETWALALRLVRKGGTINFFGGCPFGTTVSLDTSLMHYSSLTLLASFHHTPRTIRRALELIEDNAIRAADFIDGAHPLSDLPELFRSMAQSNQAVKTLIRIHE